MSIPRTGLSQLRGLRSALLVALIATSCLAVLVADAAATTTLTLRNDVPAPQTNFLGANAVYMGFAGMPEANEHGMTKELRELEYQRDAESGIKIARTYYGLDWAFPNYPSMEGGDDWTSTRMKAFTEWLSAMKTDGINVSINMGWTFPQDICSLTNVTSCTPTNTDENNFARAVSDTLNELINVDGYTNVKYIQLFTEPNGNYGGELPAGYSTHQEYYVHIAELVNEKIVSDDKSRTEIRPKIKIVGPDEVTFTGGEDTFTQYVAGHAKAGTFDVYSTHRYCSYTPPNGHCPTYENWDSVFGSFASGVSPTPLWADELGAGLQEATENNDLYRRTPDYGTYLASAVAGLTNGGVQSPFVWQLQDQYFTYPNEALYQHWGLARWLGESTEVRPSWYAYALMANLLGGGANSGGTGTWIYKTEGGTEEIHGLSSVLPEGVGGCTAAVCASLMVVNQSNKPQSVAFKFATGVSAPGLTFYRYVYNEGNPPRPTPERSGYLVRWNKEFSGLTTGIPANVVPADSVVVYSVINHGAPSATNIAESATASASSTQSGYGASNVNDGDTEQTADAAASWEPESGSSGSQYVELDWSSAKTFNRIEDNFTTGKIPSSYTMQYWNGSAWTEFSPAISVSSNDQTQRTHTFTAVSSSKLRLTLPSASATPVNEISVFDDPETPETALGFTATTDNTSSSNNKYDYEKISNASYTFHAGDKIEYDVKLADNLSQIGGIDVKLSGSCEGSEYLRNTGWTDQNGITGSPGNNLASHAYNKWYHRVLTVPACAAGLTSTSWMLASEQDGQECLAGSPCIEEAGVTGTAFYDNIVVKHEGVTALTVYKNGGPARVENELSSHYAAAEVFVTPLSP